ncbi:MAG: RNB domain-containing ribonuclease [Anaerolineaceae bacterium]
MNFVNSIDQNHRVRLQKIAHRVMLERGLYPDFSPAEIIEINQMLPSTAAPRSDAPSIRDLRGLLWCSIDNDDSLDLDQLTVAEELQDGMVKVLVAVADVDSLVKDGTAIDEHARYNTTSVYTAAEIFPMLPEKLSNGLTSLNLNEDRPAIVIEMVIGLDGTLLNSNVYLAKVLNHAKLAYNSVAAWLEGNGAEPIEISAVQGLDDNLRLQDRIAQSMRNLRHAHGALNLETIEARPIFDGDQLSDLEIEEKNRAKNIIEDFMIAANGVTAQYLSSKKFPSIRRMVRIPKRWDRIVEVAQEHGTTLPDSPDPVALEQFLSRQKEIDPVRFPDLSLTVVKLLGAGEYVAEKSDGAVPGHFGLAVKDYGHSTAPNRRYPDLITQRLLKAAISDSAVPYTFDELSSLAQHFTIQEDAANKVERQVGKSAAALLLESKIGKQFDAIITGAAAKGTWVRLLDTPVEGKVVQGYEGLDVGHRVRVQLVAVNIEQGFIDFKTIHSARR